MPTTTPHKATLRRFDGENWNPVHLATSADIVQIGEGLTVMGPGHGIYADGENIPANEAVSTIIKKLVQTRVPPVYTQPSITLTDNNGENTNRLYEFGETVNVTFTSTFTAGDAGPIVEHKIERVTASGRTTVATGTDATLTYTMTGSLSEETSFVSSCTYSDGEVKKNNFEEDCPDDKIVAGTVTSDTLTFTPARAIFYDADSAGDTTPLGTSAAIRALRNYEVVMDPAEDAMFEYTVKKGSTRFTYAAPNDIAALKPRRIEYVEAGNANVLDQFAQTSVTVEGANGAAGVAYAVYTLAWDQPISGDMTMRLVLGSTSRYNIVTSVTPDGAGTITGGGEYDEGSDITLQATPANGYEFTKWVELESTDNPITITVDSNATYTAQFTLQSYTVTYDTQGGDIIDSDEVTHGCIFSAPIPSPRKSGNLFTGWYTAATDGNKFDFDTPIYNDITLYAHWADISQLGNVVPFGKRHDTAEVIEWKVAHVDGEYAYLVTNDIYASLQFDAPEPNNPDTDRKSYGNSRWAVSNIRQWLNSDGYAEDAWYDAAHEYDAAPSYANQNGFLRNFTADEKAMIVSKSNVCARHRVDGGGSETVTDKVWLPSYYEMFGTNPTGTTVKEGEHFAGFATDAERKSSNAYWTRSLDSGNSHYVRCVDTAGTALSYGDASYASGVRPGIMLRL